MENIKEIISQANKEAWIDYCEDHWGADDTVKESFDKGFEEGLEWMITEVLVILKENKNKNIAESINKLVTAILENE